MNNTTVIQAVFDVVRTRRNGAVRTIKLSTLRNKLVSKGIFAPTETITRALRQLRDEGTVQYEYVNGSYRINSLFGHTNF